MNNGHPAQGLQCSARFRIRADQHGGNFSSPHFIGQLIKNRLQGGQGLDRPTQLDQAQAILHRGLQVPRTLGVFNHDLLKGMNRRLHLPLCQKHLTQLHPCRIHVIGRRIALEQLAVFGNGFSRLARLGQCACIFDGQLGGLSQRYFFSTHHHSGRRATCREKQKHHQRGNPTHPHLSHSCCFKRAPST